MDKLWEGIKAKNLEQVKQYCNAALEEIYSNFVGQKMQAERYKTSGGYLEYKADIAKFKSAYKRKLRVTDEYVSQFVMNSFLQEEAENDTQILMADQKLSAEDRKEELDKMHQTNMEARLQQQEMFERKMLKERNRSEKFMRKLAEEREEYTRNEKEKLNWLIEQHRQQRELSERQIEMTKEENRHQRKAHQEAIEKLTKEYDRIEREMIKRFEESQIQTQRIIEIKSFEILDQCEKNLEEEKRRSKAVEQKLNEALDKMEIVNMKMKEDIEMLQSANDQRLNQLSDALEVEREKREMLEMEIRELKREQTVLPETSQAEQAEAERDTVHSRYYELASDEADYS